MGLIRLIGAVGFMLVLRFPWEVTTVVGVLVTAHAFLTRNSAAIPLDRAGIAKQEQNAGRPGLVHVANFCVALSGALFLVSFLISFVMYMNAREQAQRESAGNYRVSSFRVLRSYWQKGSPGTMGAGGKRETRAFARGLVEGKEEWMDLAPYLGATPKDEETLSRAVPAGTIIPVYYDPELSGDYRVRVLSGAAPGVASRKMASAAARYGAATLLVTGLLLLGFLNLRRYSLASL
jgi:hypothetical protein